MKCVAYLSVWTIALSWLFTAGVLSATRPALLPPAPTPDMGQLGQPVPKLLAREGYRASSLLLLKNVAQHRPVTCSSAEAFDYLCENMVDGDSATRWSSAFDDNQGFRIDILAATCPITDVAMTGFVWSYGQLLSNWDPDTGLVRDKAQLAAGEFEAIQATGTLAAATAMAAQLGVVSQTKAVQIVSTISDTLLLDVPRFHGLLPHFVTVSASDTITIAHNTEWSSVDTVIAAIGLLVAQCALGLDTTGTEQLLVEIDWNDLLTPDGLAHGYTYSGELIPIAWDVFGGESWLVALAYAAATGQVAPMAYPTPPTANGSAFIVELPWLFVPAPDRDYWGNDWPAYREETADEQVGYFGKHYPESCLARLGLFGLSAAEAPLPSAISQESLYVAFGTGGRFSDRVDGRYLVGAPVVVPHAAALMASLRPQEAIRMWAWLIEEGPISPLNNVESLMFYPSTTCEATAVAWNPLKGSWNLSLQALGWGRYLAEREGLVPILWQATSTNPFLQDGYLIIGGN